MKTAETHKKIFEAIQKYFDQTKLKCSVCGEIPELTDFKYSSGDIYEQKFKWAGWVKVVRSDGLPGEILFCPDCAKSKGVSIKNLRFEGKP